MTLKRDSANSVILQKGKEEERENKIKSQRSSISGAVLRLEKLPVGVSHGGGKPVPLPCLCPPSMQQQHLPHLLNMWPNPHPGKMNSFVPPAPSLFLGMSKRGNSCCSHSAGAKPVCSRCAVSSRDGVGGGPAAGHVVPVPGIHHHLAALAFSSQRF